METSDHAELDPTSLASQGILPDVQKPDSEIVEAVPGNPLVEGHLEISFTAPLDTAATLQAEVSQFIASRLGNSAIIGAVEVTWRQPNEVNSPETTERREVLSLSVREALTDMGNTLHLVTRCTYALSRHDIQDIGSLLLAGRRDVREMQNIGPGVLDALDHMLRKKLPGITWKNQSTMSDIAEIFPDLDSIPGRVIGFPGKSVQQIVLSPALTASEEQAGMPGVPDYIHEKARAFAVEFFAEQAKKR